MLNALVITVSRYPTGYRSRLPNDAVFSGSRMSILIQILMAQLRPRIALSDIPGQNIVHYLAAAALLERWLAAAG